MSGPSPATPQDDNDFGHEGAAVEIDDLNLKTTDAGGRGKVLAPLFVSSTRKDEPIVTRMELWSYYCQSSSFSLLNSAVVLSANFVQSIL
jgi:hypothetical protein